MSSAQIRVEIYFLEEQMDLNSTPGAVLPDLGALAADTAASE